ncbi:MAG: response regulator [Blautia sp.]|nr:response regulator [Blautia sp.]
MDDDRQVVEDTVSLCGRLKEVDLVQGFTDSREALRWLEYHPADFALLDIHMPEMDGLELAQRLLSRHPGTAVVFLTAHPRYAVDAFAMHACGYILKPLSPERLIREVDHAILYRKAAFPSHIKVKTFGNFEILVDGRMVAFKRSRAKELLAFLVDRQGGGVSRAEIFAVLWDNRNYDHAMQKQLDVIIRSLRETLRQYQISEILEMRSGYLRIRPELLECDLYLYEEGDKRAAEAYRGEYMNNYPWGSMTEASLTRSIHYGY